MSRNVTTHTVRNPEQPPNTELQGWWLIAAWVVWIAIVALALVMFIAIERSAILATAETQEKILLSVLDAGIPVIFGAAAALILWRKYNDWMALLVALALVTIPMTFTIPSEPAFLAAYEGWIIPFIVRKLLIDAVPLLLLFFLFPNGRFVPRWAGVLILPFFIYDLITFLPLLSDPTAYDRSTTEALGAGIIVLGVLFQVYRYRRVSNSTERQQTKWVILGLAGMVSAFFLFAIGSSLPPLSGTEGVVDKLAGTSFGTFGLPVEVGAGILIFTLPLAFPVSLVFAILRYRLWDIDVVINRAVVYAVLTATLVGTYFGSVVLLQMAFRGVTGQGNAVAVVISTLTIAALFMPLRRRIQDIIDRRFFRRRYDAARTLAAFSSRMRDEVDVERLTGELVAVIEETMQPAHVSLWLRNDPGGRPQDSR